MKDTLLIVDDDDSILKCLELMLRDEFTVLTASSGNEALDMMRTSKIACIISDFDMKNGDGLFLLKNVGKKEIPFILITGHGEKEMFKSFANERAFFICEKPVTSDIVVTIRNALVLYHRTQKQLKESLIGKSTGNIMHDLHNGLAIIEGSANAALAKPDSESSKYFSITIRASKQIASMIAKYKALMGGDLQLQLSVVNINTFLADLVHDLKASYGDKYKFKFESCLADDHEVVGDPDLLRQVFLNLVTNSIYELTHDKTPTIKIRAMKNDHFTVIEVEDSGSISEETASRIFKEGYSTKKAGGTGMGLCYCRDLLQRMSANIQLTKRTPTTFSISFSAKE
jgi:signal transduction histidine kinase